ncbi:MAG: DUF1573 domain-containing protein, partial [Bacteroidales bacterium]|nr:DUF1573 domain-containing protein [Bacteroidales bacterium]
MKRIMLLFCLAGIIVPLMSQTVQAKISFNETTHEFGKFKEADGKVSYKFEFVNTGGSDLIIQNVSASCGCTAPS